MPSGAKKRKAAKKKKQQASNSSATNNPLGNDDPKSQDERDSDGGDVGSPASQDDHNHHHPFSQGGDEGKIAQSHVTEEKPVKEATKDAQKDLESTRVSIQHVEHDKSSSRSSSSSSSDDESQADEKKSKGQACNLGSEVASNSSEEKKSKGQACNLGSEVASDSSEDISATVVSEEAPKVAGNETLENVDSNSAVGAVAVDNSVQPVLLVAEEMDISANNSVPDEFESGLKENEEKILATPNGISGVEGSGNFTSSDIPPTAETSNVAEKYQASEHRDGSEKQPPVASTPPPLQRSSLLSCCGLFEVFTGSGR